METSLLNILPAQRAAFLLKMNSLQFTKSLGIGLAHMCLASGYKCVIYMPDTQSQVGLRGVFK